MSEHAILAPSSAARWVQCPGSIAMCMMLPPSNDDPEASEEGTRAHELAASLLRGMPISHTDDEEMFEAAALYSNTIRGMFAAQVETCELHVEERIECEQIHSDNWGTPDAWMFNRAKMILDVFDFKYGFGYVEVFENWQLLDYTVGILKKLGVITSPTTINLHIVQPRSYHSDGPIRTWTLTLAQLSQYESILHTAAKTAMSTNAPCMTGAECKHCSARSACPALLTVGYAAIDFIGKSLPLNMSPQVVGMILKQIRDGLKRLEAIETGLTQQATLLLRNGKRVPGYNLESGQGRLTWKVPADEVLALESMMGISISVKKLITPTQAIAAGLDKELVGAFAERPVTAVKLVEDGIKIRGVFNK